MENMNQMVDSLWLTPGEIHWHLALYWIFFVNIILLMIQPEGSAFATLLGIGVLLSAVIDKTYAFGYMLDPGTYTPVQYHEEVFIGTYLVRVIMFVAPLTIAGSTRNPKVRGLAILAGISGAVYMFARWYFEQRDSNVGKRISYLDIQYVGQSVGLLLLLGRVWLRKSFRSFPVHGHIPVTVSSEISANEVEVQIP